MANKIRKRVLIIRINRAHKIAWSIFSKLMFTLIRVAMDHNVIIIRQNAEHQYDASQHPYIEMLRGDRVLRHSNIHIEASLSLLLIAQLKVTLSNY